MIACWWSYPYFLFEQYANARARLAEDREHGAGGFSDNLTSSLGQSDMFFDCVDGQEDSIGTPGTVQAPQMIGSGDRDTARVRVRIAGLDVTLVVPKEYVDPENLGSRVTQQVETFASSSSDSGAASGFYLKMRRVSQVAHSHGTRLQSVVEVGTLVVDFADGSATLHRPVRLLAVVDEADASACLNVTFCSGGASDDPGESGRVGEAGISVDVECLPIEIAVHMHPLALMKDFLAQALPQAHSSGSGQATGVTAGRNLSHRQFKVAGAIPTISVRLPARQSACFSEAYSALVKSVTNCTSPVGWERREAVEEAAPALVLGIEGAVVNHAVAQAGGAVTTLECVRVRCQMLLRCDVGESERDGVHNIGLYFLEAFRPPGSHSEEPLKVEYGHSEDLGKVGRFGMARPNDADLNFLHTWEPSDG